MALYLIQVTKMNLKILTLTLESDRKFLENAHKLRGFFAGAFNEYVLLHHHKFDKYVYDYPLIQYKMIDSKPMVIGINEGIDVLKEIYDKYDEIRLGDSRYTIYERQITVKEQTFGISDKPQKYVFLTPWFALNQKNYPKYVESDTDARKELLKRILTSNFISVSKGLNYNVKSQIKVEISLREITSSFKRIKIPAFKGEFKVNFNIPDHMGIGKSVSRGFGTIKKIE